MLHFPVNVGTIAEEHGASLDVSGELSLERITLGTETYEFEGPVTFDVTIADTGTAYIALGKANGVVHAQCARCLRDFDLPVEGDVDIYFVQAAHADEVPEEQDWALVDGDQVDLGPAIETALSVAMPLAPLHDPECRGICPECGTDLNEETCDCDTEGAAGPFAALGGLLEELEADEGEARK